MVSIGKMPIYKMSKRPQVQKSKLKILNFEIDINFLRLCSSSVVYSFLAIKLEVTSYQGKPSSVTSRNCRKLKFDNSGPERRNILMAVFRGSDYPVGKIIPLKKMRECDVD